MPTLGIGESDDDEQTEQQTVVKARILLPNVRSSLSLEDGHTVTFEVNTDSGFIEHKRDGSKDSTNIWL